MPDERIQRVAMPKWGLSMATGTITEWLVSEGDDISDGIELAEIDTDKIAGTLEASQEGILRRIVVPAGTDAPVGGTIAVVAPADVADSDIEEIVAEAEERLAAGTVEEAAGPTVAEVRVGGRSISYATLGEGGETVVLVHGFGGDKDSWLFVHGPLAEGRTVHALDLPGHGASSKDVGDGSWARCRARSSGSWTRWGSSAPTWWGTRWAGPSSRPRPPPRRDGCVRCPWSPRRESGPLWTPTTCAASWRPVRAGSSGRTRASSSPMRSR